MRTKVVIRAPYNIRSLMKRKQASKLIRYTKKDYQMSDQGLAGINLWLIVDKADKIEYYIDKWTTRWSILFTDRPVKLDDDSVGQFIVVWRWRRDLIAAATAFKTFKQAKKFMDCAIGASYWLGRHPETFRTSYGRGCNCDEGDDCDCDEDFKIDYVNTLSGGVASAFSCYGEGQVKPKKRKRQPLDVDRMRERKFNGKIFGLESVYKNPKAARKEASVNQKLGFLFKITKRKSMGVIVYDLWLHHPDEWR